MEREWITLSQSMALWSRARQKAVNIYAKCRLKKKQRYDTGDKLSGDTKTAQANTQVIWMYSITSFFLVQKKHNTGEFETLSEIHQKTNTSNEST